MSIVLLVDCKDYIFSQTNLILQTITKLIHFYIHTLQAYDD